MATDLYRLVYFSRNLIPGTPDAIVGDIDAILAISQRNNSRVGVTGALIFNSGIFAQVLEGPRSEIEATFERIQRDDRHGDVQVLAFEKVQGRGFPSWSMAFVGRSRDGQALFERLGEASGFEARRLEGERIFTIMRDIAIDEEQRVA
jgi:Sensors of blue-light using FAD